MNTVEICENLVKDKVRELGFEIYEVEYAEEFGEWVLTVTIDREGGVTIDDCETVSRAIEPILDENDPIEGNYYLSVSSVGIDRPLKKEADYKRNLGVELEVKLTRPKMGKKLWIGKLESYKENSFTIRTDKGPMSFEKRDTSLIRPYIRFK